MEVADGGWEKGVREGVKGMSTGTVRHPPRVTADSSLGKGAAAQGPPGSAKEVSDSVQAKAVYQRGIVDFPGAAVTMADDHTPDVVQQKERTMADADGEMDVEKG